MFHSLLRNCFDFIFSYRTSEKEITIFFTFLSIAAKKKEAEKSASFFK